MTPLTLPTGTGMEAAGVVDEVDEGRGALELGKKPAELPFEEAAGYPVTVETALRILAQVRVQPGKTLRGVVISSNELMNDDPRASGNDRQNRR